MYKKNQTRNLDTDSLRLKTFAYYLRQISQNTDFLDLKNLTYNRVFFKENVSYPVWICRDPISLILGNRFSLILGAR